MPRRNLIPLVLLGVLAVATAVFAVLGATSAPAATTVTVENAVAQTYGSPIGANSFILDLRTTESAGTSNGSVSEERLVDYVAPDRMVVYDPSNKRSVLVHQPGISCALTAYAAMLQGPASWSAQGDTYKRTETLATYTARVPRTGTPTCTPQQTNAQGHAQETAVIRSGYLVGARVVIVVPAQTLGNGQAATHGVESSTFVFINIAGVPVRTIVP